MKKIAVLEPGAWGTALGIVLNKKNIVGFWYESKKLALKISKSRCNERLPETKVPEEISISSNLQEVIEETDLIIIGSPTFSFRKTVLKLKNFKSLPPLIGIAKGIEKDTLKMPSQIVEEILEGEQYIHLSGPGFAREIAKGKKAKEVLASKNKGLLKEIKKIFTISPLQPITSDDLIGVQLAGALKNALAIGISLVEAGSKDEKVKKLLCLSKKKLVSSLIKLGLEEMIRLGSAMGAKQETFLGPAGLEDLILTSTNPLSRNFQFGKRLYFDAKGMRKNIQKRKITVEGFDNSWALYKLSKIYKVDLPFIEEIYKIIYEKISPQNTFRNLLRLAGGK